ncbi:hypothetical protein JHK87_009912 [Glycine soja]|nr:hypothetical protein JHK87_009912 [Glycine soja]
MTPARGLDKLHKPATLTPVEVTALDTGQHLSSLGGSTSLSPSYLSRLLPWTPDFNTRQPLFPASQLKAWGAYVLSKNKDDGVDLKATLSQRPFTRGEMVSNIKGGGGKEFDMRSVPSLGLEDETKKLWETQVMISYSLTEKSFCRSVPPYQQSLSIFFQVLRKKSLLSMMISLKWIS